MKKYFADAAEAKDKIIKIIKSYPGLIDAMCVSLQNGSFTQKELKTQLSTMVGELDSYLGTYLGENYPKK